MKDKLMTEIQSHMTAFLTSEQLEELKTVLGYCFSKVEVAERRQTAGVQNGSNHFDILNKFIAAKRIEGCSEKSLKYYAASIKRLLTSYGKAVPEITTEDLRGYLAQFQQERNSSKVTIDNLRRIFASFFGWLENEDYILKSPVRRIHRIKTDKTIKEALTDEGLEQVRDACVQKRDLALIDLLASTGMRVGELVKLNRSDINFQERECAVFGKGNSERMVYFDARTKNHLLNYLAERTDDNPALFVALAKPHKRLMIGGVETRVRRIGAQAALPKVHPHKFRRTLATRAIDKGMPIEQVQKLLGHVKIETTMHYALVNQTNVKNAHRKFIG